MDTYRDIYPLAQPSTIDIYLGSAVVVCIPSCDWLLVWLSLLAVLVRPMGQLSCMLSRSISFHLSCEVCSSHGSCSHCRLGCFCCCFHCCSVKLPGSRCLPEWVKPVSRAGCTCMTTAADKPKLHCSPQDPAVGIWRLGQNCTSLDRCWHSCCPQGP